MRVLVHVCCGPCALVPLSRLRVEGHALTALFYNPNIHPLAEYLRRRAGAAQAADACAVPLLFPEQGASAEYDCRTWCREALTATQTHGRCGFCWRSRLDYAAHTARRLGMDAFCTSLLYSRRQNHEGIAEAGRQAGEEAGVAFLYRDFRPHWQEGIERSKALGIYRQPYCGCVFSEEERYSRELAKAVAESPATETAPLAGEATR